MNINELSDDDLAQHKRDVLIEEERRQARDQIPSQIADLAQHYIDAGGDPNDLTYRPTRPADGPVIVE